MGQDETAADEGEEEGTKRVEKRQKMQTDPGATAKKIEPKKTEPKEIEKIRQRRQAKLTLKIEMRLETTKIETKIGPREDTNEDRDEEHRDALYVR